MGAQLFKDQTKKLIIVIKGIYTNPAAKAQTCLKNGIVETWLAGV